MIEVEGGRSGKGLHKQDPPVTIYGTLYVSIFPSTMRFTIHGFSVFDIIKKTRSSILLVISTLLSI